jgi:transcriptional regulator with XRE-family HTH domain
MINKALREKRKAAGLSQDGFSRAIDMQMQNYSKKERGLVRITAPEAVRMARILGCTVEDITPEVEQ